MGPANDPTRGAAWWSAPDVAYNAMDDIYLVVRSGDDLRSGVVNDDFEFHFCGSDGDQSPGQRMADRRQPIA